MAKSLREKLASLPAERRERIEAEAARLHAEYRRLKELGKAKEPLRE